MANSFTSVVAIDDAGQILGLSPNDLGIAGCGGALTQFFTNAPPQDVGPNATSLASSAAGLSVIGEYTQEPGCTGTVSPARYPGFASVAVPSDFLMDELSTVVSDINSANAVIGFGATTAGLTATFYSVGNNAMEIDPPAGYNTLQGNGLNDSGWIVGTFYEAPSAVPEHAFLWANGKTIDLNALLPANCAWTLNTAADVNDSGYIVGTGTVNGAAHGFLLIPKY
jgi:probable HAF family extracellular repeat protein